MLNNKQKLDARIYEVATIIKLVATMNIKGVCTVANNLIKHYDEDTIDAIDNQLIYDSYCKCGEQI